MSTDTDVWSEIEFAVGDRAHWRIGPWSLWVHRTATEWILASATAQDPFDSALDRGSQWSEPPPEDADRIRCVADSTSGSLRPVAALADRAIVIRPEHPLGLLGGEQTRLYVTTQLWVRVVAGRPVRTLVERPTFRLSDTWLGPSTREGELCYASSTRARTSLDELRVAPARAITCVTLRNASAETLWLERVKLPVPQLELFVSERGEHWTQSVTVERKDGDAGVTCRIDTGPPPEAPTPRRIAGARTPMVRSFTRALGALIG